MAEATDGQSFSVSPGAELSRERERQGLSQQQVAEQLNLDASVIHWIEDDNFAALGAPVFAKGHLRRYCALLGLPPERLLEAYAHGGAQPTAPTLIPKAREDRAPERPPPRWPWVMGGAAGLALLVAFVALVIERWPDQTRRGTEPPTPVVAPKQDAVPVVAAPAAGPSDAVAVPQAPPVAPVTLQLSFSKDTWVEVYDGSGAAVLYDLGSRGTERTVRATPPISVTLGDPGSVAVYANGARLKVPAARSGQSLTRFTIDASGAVR